MKKKSIIILSIIFLFIIAGVIGYTNIKVNEIKSLERQISIKENNKELINANDALSTVAQDETVVLPTARIKIKQSYKKCGHTVTEEFSVPEDIVNMTEKEVEKYYFGWKIESFSSKEITIFKVNNGICEEHYIVKDVEGKVTVFRKDDNEDEILVLATEANTKYLPSEDREKLEQGINIVGKDNLSILLEDYE